MARVYRCRPAGGPTSEGALLLVSTARTLSIRMTVYAGRKDRQSDARVREGRPTPPEPLERHARYPEDPRLRL